MLAYQIRHVFVTLTGNVEKLYILEYCLVYHCQCTLYCRFFDLLYNP